MPRIIVTPRAVADLRQLAESRGLPDDSLARTQRSLRMLERFPLAGRALTGRWQGTRCVLGPWPWMIVVYVYDTGDDAVSIVAVHDGRSSTAAR